MTKEERHLWYDFLKPLPFMVHRQKVIGNYIVDFYIASKQIVIELDGSQHYEPEGQERDEKRTLQLNQQGILVLRFANNDVWKNFPAVCEKIDACVKKRIEG